MAYVLAPVAWRAVKSFFGPEEGDKQDANNSAISAVVTFLAKAFTVSILARLFWRSVKALILASEADNQRYDETQGEQSGSRVPTPEPAPASCDRDEQKPSEPHND